MKKRIKDISMVGAIVLAGLCQLTLSGCAKQPAACFDLPHANPFKVGEEIQFDGSCSSNARYYSWYFKDGTFTNPSADPKSSHTYTAAGSYMVKLKAEGKNSNESNVELEVNIVP